LFSLVAGCDGGPAATPVSGKLLDNGAAVKPPANLPPGDKGVRMSFVQEAASGKTPETHFAQLSDDGSFRVDGPNKKGIPPGKYRISVQIGAMGTPTMKTVDLPAVEIPSSKKAVTVEVDVGKKTATVTP
jgi:hypothetical protein